MSLEEPFLQMRVSLLSSRDGGDAVRRAAVLCERVLKRVAVVFGLNTRLGGQRSAVAALIAGVVVFAWGAHVRPIDHPFLASLVAAFATYLLAAVPIGRTSTATTG